MPYQLAFSLLICTYRKYVLRSYSTNNTHNNLENCTCLKMKPTLMKTKLLQYLPKLLLAKSYQMISNHFKTSNYYIAIKNVEKKVFNSTSKQLN